MVVLSAAGRFRWCGLRPRLGALLTVSVPSVNSAYSAESADGTLFSQSSFNIQNIAVLGAGADGAVFRDAPAVIVPCAANIADSLADGGLYHSNTLQCKSKKAKQASL